MRVRLRDRSGRELAVLVVACVLVPAVRLGLWLLPSPPLLRFAAARARGADTPARLTPTVRAVGWAVRAASRRAPRATCLTQALSAQLLLALLGYSSSIRVGVAAGSGAFAAHAWIEVDGRILVGGNEVGRYVELPSLESRV